MVSEPSEFATTLDRAIQARGLSLQRLRHRLAEAGFEVSIATLSYWKNGHSRPTRTQSQAMLAALEKVLEVEPGTLVRAAPLNPTRRRPDESKADKNLPNTVEGVLEATGMQRGRLRKVSAGLSLTLGEQREELFEEVRSVVQCLTAGARSLPVLQERDVEGGFRLQGTSNCRAGRSWDLPEEGFMLAELVLSHPLREGEYCKYSYRCELNHDEPSHEYIVSVPRLQELVMEVAFRPGDLPSRVVAYAVPPDQDPTQVPGDAVEVVLAEASAQHVLVDCPAGIHVLRWWWSDEERPSGESASGTRPGGDHPDGDQAGGDQAGEGSTG